MLICRVQVTILNAFAKVYRFSYVNSFPAGGKHKPQINLQYLHPPAENYS